MSDAPAPGPIRASATFCDNCGVVLRGDFCSDVRPEGRAAPAAGAPLCARLGRRVFRARRTRLANARHAAVRPGSLTTAYLAGRRQRYLRPLRVYLSSTLLFFVLLSIVDPAGLLRDRIADNGRGETDQVQVAAHLAENDSAVAQGLTGFLVEVDDIREDIVGEFGEARTDTAGAPAALQVAVADSIAAALAAADSSRRRRASVEFKRARAESAMLRTMPPDSLIYASDVHDAVAVLYPDTVGMFSAASDQWLVRSEATRRIRDGQTESEKAAGVAAFVRSAIGYVPTVLFLILPIFALLLKALYARRDWFYSEHLVFGLHTHAYAFLVFAIVTVTIWTALRTPVGRSGRRWDGRQRLCSRRSLSTFSSLRNASTGSRGARRSPRPCCSEPCTTWSSASASSGRCCSRPDRVASDATDASRGMTHESTVGQNRAAPSRRA